MNRWLASSTFACCVSLSAALATANVTGTLASKLDGKPPEIPVGGKSANEIKEKMKAGEFKRVSRSAKSSDKVEAKLDVEYGKGDGTPLLLDLYKPKVSHHPAPGLIFVHGGSWSGGNRKVYGFYCQHFAEKGYVAATVEYRLSGQAAFPAAIQDVKCAIRWMRANAEKLGVDPNKIGVVGGSAGGHLVLLAAYANTADAELDGTGGNPGVSSRVQAVVDLYGPITMSDRSRAVRKFMGGKTQQEAPQQYAKAAPFNHLTKDAPPTLIMHGTVDELVPISQSDKLSAKLNELGVPYLYDRQEGWHHAMDAVAVVNPRCVWLMDQFLSQVLPVTK